MSELEILVKLLELFGLPLVAARILSVLLMEGRPLSLEELSRRTGYVKSHVSTALRYLEEKLLIERIYGKRRKLIIRLREGALRDLVREHIERIKTSIHEVLEAIQRRGGPEEAVRELLRILEELESKKR